jgi:hypothetical protein
MYVFSIDIPFKGSQSLEKMMPKVIAVSYLHSGVNNSAVPITAVAMTPLCTSQQSQRLRWNFFQICIAAQQCQLLRCARHSGVNDSAVHVTAVSTIPLYKSQRSHWLCCDKNWQFQSWVSQRILIHIQKGFNPCIRGLGGVVLWKKPEVKNLVPVSL